MSIRVIRDTKEKIRCNICGKEFDKVDYAENNIFDLFMGYGSRHDEERYNINLCCDCADNVLDSILGKCIIDPLVDNDYMTHATDADNIIHESWGPGKIIHREPFGLQKRDLETLNPDEIRVFSISSINISDDEIHKTLSVLLFDGTYMNTASSIVAYEDYLKKGKKENEWETIDLGESKWGNTILYIRKVDKEWFTEKNRKINEIISLFARSAEWVNLYEERMNEEKDTLVEI